MTETVTEVLEPEPDERLRGPAALIEMGCTYRQMTYWVKAGYLRPDNAGRGSGVAQLWPVEEVRVGWRMVRLERLGFKPDRAAALARDPEQCGQLVQRMVDIWGNQ